MITIRNFFRALLLRKERSRRNRSADFSPFGDWSDTENGVGSVTTLRRDW